MGRPVQGMCPSVLLSPDPWAFFFPTSSSWGGGSPILGRIELLLTPRDSDCGRSGVDPGMCMF